MINYTVMLFGKFSSWESKRSFRSMLEFVTIFILKNTILCIWIELWWNIKNIIIPKPLTKLPLNTSDHTKIEDKTQCFREYCIYTINSWLFYFILCRQVFLTEYAGPLVIYLIFYARPACIYGSLADTPKASVVK